MSKKCPHCSRLELIKKGYYFVQHSSSWIRRYHCLSCKKTFSSKTHSPTYKQVKPFLNIKIFSLLTDGASQRAAARILNCSKNTIARKLLWLHKFKEQIPELKFEYIHSSTWMLDEMESIEHTKLKPVTIPLVVDNHYQIRALGVGRIPAKGYLANISQKKYSFRVNERELVLRAIFNDLAKQIPPEKIITDGSTVYTNFIKEFFPNTKHEVVNAQELQKLKREKIYTKAYKKVFDPMFALNQRCAKLRSDIKRLTRRSWCSTKKIENLKAHLELYQIKNNLELQNSY